MGDQTPDDFKEVTEAEKAKIEAQDALWERPPQSFIDMWKALYRGCDYNPKTGYFSVVFINTSENIEQYRMNDITYEEALLIYRYGTFSSSNDVIGGGATSRLAVPQIRCFIPVSGWSQNMNLPGLGWLPDTIEIISLFQVPSYTNGDSHLMPANNTALIYRASSLKHIFDKIQPQADNFKIAGYLAPTLETVFLHKISKNIDASLAPALSLDSFKYMVEYAVNTAAITITVHPDVYAKLTDPDNAQWHQLNQDAAEKQIAFATV